MENIYQSPKSKFCQIFLSALLFWMLSATVLLAQPGNALRFNGSNNYVALPNTLTTAATLSSNNGITIEYWFRGTSILSAVRFQTSSTYIIAGYSMKHVISTDGDVNGGIEIPSYVLDGRWHHIAMTWQRNTVNGFKSYVDGQLVAQRNSANVNLPTITTNGFLGTFNTASEFTNGNMDEVRIYNTAISQANIQYDMVNSNSQVSLSLLAHYNFNQGVSGGTNTGLTSVRDTSGKANHALAVNFTLTGTVSNYMESYAMVVPTATAATAINSVGFTANWLAPTQGIVNTYLLDVSTTPDFTGAISGSPFTVASSSLSQNVTGLTSGTYYYRIRPNKTTLDLQGSNSATIAVTVPYTTPANALAFDGVNDFVSLPNGIVNSLSGNATIETWFLWNGGNGWQRVFDFGNNRSNYILFTPLPAGGDPRPFFQIYNGSITNNIYCSKPLVVGKWIHLAITINASTNIGSIYINGELVGQNTNFTLRANTIGNSITNYLGKSQYDDAYFNGKIDEFRIWSVAKTQAEIQAGMKVTAASNASNLIANYRFDQGVAGLSNTHITTLIDSSLNAYNATLSNFSGTGLSSNWVESYALAIPTATAASAVTTTGFTANWTAPSIGIVNNYFVDVAIDPNFASPISGSPFTVTGNTTFSKAFTGLQSNLNYYYRVRADRTFLTGQGALSNTIIARTANALTPPGNCLAMDGANDYLSIPANTGINNEFANNRITLETWVNLKSLPTGGTAPSLITEAYNGVGGYNIKFAIYLYENGLYAGHHNGNWTSAKYLTPLPLNRWVHIACTYDQTQIKLYVDGTLVATENSTLALPPGSEDWFIGKRWDYQETINGSMDEVRIYNEALTQSQIQSDMRDTTIALPGNLVAYYNFDQGTSAASNTGISLLTDRSSSTLFTANLNNFALTGANSNFISSYSMVAPKAVAATSITSSGFTANWTAPLHGVTNNYLLDVSTSSDFTGAIVGSPFTLSASTFSQGVTGLIGGTYYYRVRAVNTNFVNQGAVSNTISVLVPYNPPGNALQSDASQDIVTIPMPNGNINGFTMEAWVNPTANTFDWQTVFAYGFDNGSVGNGIALYINQAGELAIQYPAVAQVYLQKKLPLGRWSHLTLTRSGNVAKVYLNGEQLNIIGYSNPNPPTAEVRLLGHTGIRFFNGKMDEFRFWNSVRTDSQIKADMVDVTTSNTPSLLVYYKFDQGVAGAVNTSTNVILDQTPNKNNGNTAYFAYSGSTGNWVESYAAVVPKATDATAITSSTFTANWIPAQNGTINGYFIEVSTTPDFTGPIAGSPFSAAANATSKAFTNLLGGTYYYRVSASKTSMPNTGAYSNSITVKVPYTPPGNAMSFDGVNDRLKLNDPNVGNFYENNFTVEFWMKTYANAGYLVTKRDQCGHGSFFNINYNTNGINLEVDQDAGGTNYLAMYGTTPVNDGRWHHVAIVREGINYKIYLDGVVNASQNTRGVTWIGNGNPIDIGARYCHDMPFNGSMDELRIWSVARTKDQINANLDSMVSPTSLGLTAYYNFDEGVGGLFNYDKTILRDQTPSGYNGYTINMALEALNTNWVESYAMVVPTMVEPTNITPSGFTLNWIAPPLGVVSNYFVDVSLSSNFTAPISGSPFNVTGNTLTLSGLASSTFYCRVRANRTGNVVAGEGAPSNVKTIDLKYTPPGNSLNFDGNNDYGIIPKTVTGDFTIEYWVRTTATGQKGIVDNEVGGSPGDIQNGISNGKIYFILGSGSDVTITSNTTVNTGLWYHVALTRKQTNGGSTGTIKLYINGSLEASNSNAGTGAINASGQFTLGCVNGYAGNSSYSFIGSIDELRIWNVERSFTEISQYFKDTVSRNSANLVDYYNFDQGIGGANNTGVVTLKDIAGTDNGGTITNFALSGATSNWVNTYNISVNAPNTLTASTNSCGTIDLNWQIPSTPSGNCETSTNCDASNFKQYIYVEDSLLAIVPSSATSFSFNVNQIYNNTRLIRGINYKFVVRTAYTPPFFNFIRTSLPTNIATGKFKDNPAVPAGFSASVERCDGSITLGWTWADANPQNGFVLNRAEDSSMTSQQVMTFPGTQRSYNDPGLQRGKFYYYRIFARNDCYNATAPDSMYAGVSDSMTIVRGISPQVPARPTNVSIFSDSINNLITIRWKDNSNNEDKFIIERSALGGLTTTFDANPNDTVFVDDQAAGCVSYNYTVKAVSGCAINGMPSLGLNQTRITPNLSNTFDDTSSYHLTCSKGYYPDKVELNWNNRNSAQLTSIRIYRKIANTTNDSNLIASVLSGSGLYIDNSTVAGILYRYYLIGETQCAGVTRYSNMTSDIGFRSPSGTISGNITYAGGFAVKGVRVLAQNTSFNKGGGLAFDGIDDYIKVPHKSSIDVNPTALTIEAWFKPLERNSFILVSKVDSLDGGYRLLYDSASNQLQFMLFNATDSQQVNVDSPFVSFTSYNQITASFGSDSIRIYVNGLEAKTVATRITYVGIPSKPLYLGGDPNLGIYGMGNMDEVRIWKIAKTKAQIEEDFYRTISNNNGNLVLYYTFDDRFPGLTETYDQSNLNLVFNENHAKFINGTTYTDSIPNSSQLGLASYTNEVGDYSINNARYLGTGQNYTVVPSLNIHSFTPNNRIVFVGDGAQIINSINFSDNSSFEFLGTVKYAGTTCPATGATIYIDNQPAVLSNQFVTVNDSGKFVVRVPIGNHVVSLQKDKHVFSQGTFPERGVFNFTGPVSVNFTDSTFLTVVGRVAGGNRELAKLPGLGRGKNNIGKAQFTFNSVGFSGINGCFTKSIVTNDSTGEYTAILLPLRYTINGLRLVNNLDPTILTNPLFNNPNLVDLTSIPELTHIYDTLVTPLFSRIDSVSYHTQLDFKYFVTPSIYVTDTLTAFDSLVNNFIGEKKLKMNDSLEFDISNNELGYPLFNQFADYFGYLKVVEEYTNIDLPLSSNKRVDKVPVRGNLRIYNSLCPPEGYFTEVSLEDDLFPLYFRGGSPNLLNNTTNPQYNFTKTLQIEFVPAIGSTINYLPNKFDLVSQFYRGYLFGSAAGNSYFTTTGPKTVDLILRDPPGSASSTTWSKGVSFTTAESWNVANAYGAGVSTTSKFGKSVSIVTGLGVASINTFESVLDITAEASFSKSISKEGSIVTTISTTKSLSTGSDPGSVGANADVYFGTAQNIIFGIANQILMIDTASCRIIEQGGSGMYCSGNDFNGFKIANMKSFFVAPGGIKTTFAYTQDEILNIIIPDLEGLRNQFLTNNILNARGVKKYVSVFSDANDPLYSRKFGSNNDDPIWGSLRSSNTVYTREAKDTIGASYIFHGNTMYEVDSIRFYNNQITLWKKAIARNEAEKYKAINNTGTSPVFGGSNISVGKVAYSEEFSTSRDEEYTENVEWQFDETFGLSHGFEWNKFGLDVTLSANFSQTRGSAKTSGKSASTTYAYTLQDGDDGDLISVDIVDPKDGNGHLFKLRSGRTSCPYEGKQTALFYDPSNDTITATTLLDDGFEIQAATAQNDLPLISVNQRNNFNVPATDDAIFVLDLGNLSEGHQDRTYSLRVDQSTNPYGAILKVDGLDPNRDFDVPYGSTIQKTLTLKRGPNHYDYDNIRLILKSQCDDDIFDTVTISAHFLPTCTSVQMKSPEDRWILNNSYHDTLPVLIGGYNYNWGGFKAVHFQYKPGGTNTWYNERSFYKDTADASRLIPLGEPNIFYPFNFKNLPDGNYELRATTECIAPGYPNNRVNSTVMQGLVDRINPTPFGTPSPADGILSPNDDISIQFNEPIEQSTLSLSNFEVKGVLNKSSIRSNTSIYFDGNNDYLEVAQPLNLQLKPFTIEFWHKRGGLGKQVLFSQGADTSSSFELGFAADNKLYFRMGSETVSSLVPVTDTTVYNFIAVSYNSVLQTADLFINEQVVNIGNNRIFNPYDGSGKFYMGKASVGIPYYAKGNVYEVRVWGLARTLTDANQTKSKLLTSSEAGLLGNWRMDEATGKLAKDNARSRHATIVNAQWFLSPMGKSYTFDGSGDYITVPTNHFGISKEMDFTLEFWFKGANGNNVGLVSNGTGLASATNPALKWSIETDTAGRIVVKHNGVYFLATNTNYFDGNWHHAAFVLRRNSSFSCYVDANLQNSIPSGAIEQWGGGKLWFGAKGWNNTGNLQYDSTSNYFTGQLDDLRFWNSSRLIEQIKRDKNNRLNGDEAGLVLYVPFESYQEVQGFPVLNPTDKDVTTNTRTLTAFGDATYSDQSPTLKLPRAAQSINFTYGLNGDKIIISPTTANEFIENVTLDITVKGVMDKNGNVMQSPKTWIAYVDKNQVKWQDDLRVFDKVAAAPLSFQASITNSGGALKDYTIGNLPAWLKASTTNASINPNSSQTITFTVDPTLNIGKYEQDLSLTTDFGFADKLLIKLNVNAVAPAWEVKPGDFSKSMSIVGQVRINNVISANTEDMLGAFSNNVCRGVAKVQYYEQLDKYLVFMDVYGNVDNEPLEFRIWNSATGKTHVEVTPVLNFVSNNLIGSVNTPQIFNALDKVSEKIILNQGWNWISFNLLMTDSSNLNNLFTSINPSVGNQIKNNTQMAIFDTSNGWSGNLATLSAGVKPESSYLMYVNQADTLDLRGVEANPTLRPINLTTGWNYMGFVSQRNLSTNEALAGWNASQNDLVKGQTSFAVYDTILGWVGSLTALRPNAGYLYKSATTGSFVYPRSAMFGKASVDLNEVRSNYWSVTPAKFQNTMSVIAKVNACSNLGTNPTWLLGAFVNSELRGFTRIQNKKTNEPFYFLSVSGVDADQVTFRLLDENTGLTYALDQSINFKADAIVGNLVQPIVLGSNAPCTPIKSAVLATSSKVFPVPFTDGFTVELELAQSQKVSFRLLDISNKEISVTNAEEYAKGINQISIKPGNIPAGVYIIEIEGMGETIRHKVIKM
ncbi:MAG: hypothetical protein CFE21_03105 [Bacteroidetes bacterium B1(2017)]|nr:MAG: hypothetical protein CFE21_03105 [Bacteroidetes bacterium B1(2017)]